MLGTVGGTPGVDGAIALGTEPIGVVGVPTGQSEKFLQERAETRRLRSGRQQPTGRSAGAIKEDKRDGRTQAMAEGRSLQSCCNDETTRLKQAMGYRRTAARLECTISEPPAAVSQAEITSGSEETR